jgi:hypothetical protein
LLGEFPEPRTRKGNITPTPIEQNRRIIVCLRLLYDKMLVIIFSSISRLNKANDFGRPEVVEYYAEPFKNLAELKTSGYNHF